MSAFLKILRCIFCCYDEDFHETERDYRARLLGTYNHNSSVRNSSYRNSSVRNSSFTNHDLLRQHDPNKIYYYEYYPNVSISESTTKQPNAMSQQSEYGNKSSLKGNNEVSQSLKSSRSPPRSSSFYTCSSSINKSKSLTQPSSFPKPALASSKPFLSPKGPAPSSSTTSSSSFPKPAIPSSKASLSLSNPALSALSQSLSSPKPPSFYSDQHQLPAKPPASPSPCKSSQSLSGSTLTKQDAAPEVLKKLLSQKAPSSTQPTLSPLPPNSANQQKKDSYLLVEKGASNYKIPKDIEDLSKKDIVPDVLKKPLSPSTYKDYSAELLYAEDFYYEKGSSPVYMPPNNNENLMKKEAVPEVLKKPSSPSSQKTPSSSKPTLSPLPNDSTNQQAKENHIWVQKGTLPDYENLMKKEVLPEVLTKPSSPSSHKSPSSSKPPLSPLPSDSTNQQTKGNDIWVQKGTSAVYTTPKSNENLMKKEVVLEVLKKPSSPLFHKAPSSFKPTLSPLPTDSTNQHKKASYIWVQKGTTNYKIPKDIEDLIKKDIVPEVLKKPLFPSTYKDYFATLLYAEDFYEEKWSGFQLLDVTLELREAAISDESLKNKHLKKSDQKGDKLFVAFKIDSIPERRPFLLSRDFVYAQRSGGKSKKFQGLLYRVVKSATVLVEFEEDFYSQHRPNHKYDISFSFNRVCLKRAHEAIAAASDSLFRNYLFPDCASRKSIPYPSPCPYGNYKIDLDGNSAVRQILSFQGQPPYLVEGPLCVTRKEKYEYVLTETGNVVREAVLQICQHSPKSRILICAALNRTCDKLMESLMEDIPESEMFRANAAFREADGVSDEIFQVSLVEGECFSCPPLEELRQYRVISSTFVSSFRLRNQGITAGHFSHIFLVDASSATEPETLIVLSNLANENTRVIVTGAPRNRPSRVRSDIARKNGLTMSYFERLCLTKAYRSCNPMFYSWLSTSTEEII